MATVSTSVAGCVSHSSVSGMRGSQSTDPSRQRAGTPGTGIDWRPCAAADAAHSGGKKRRFTQMAERAANSTQPSTYCRAPLQAARAAQMQPAVPYPRRWSSTAAAPSDRAAVSGPWPARRAHAMNSRHGLQNSSAPSGAGHEREWPAAHVQPPGTGAGHEPAGGARLMVTAAPRNQPALEGWHGTDTAHDGDKHDPTPR